MCIILEKNDEGLVFGRIKLTLIGNATAVYFVTEKSQLVHLVSQKVYTMSDHKLLLDYYPLPEYNMLGLSVISLHHSFLFL